MDSPRSKGLTSENNIQTAGFDVDKKELQQAFDFFDTKKKGYITADDLKARLPIFYQNMTAREIKFLMNNKAELQFNDLFELLQNNMLSNFDPAAEAFKIYDPAGTGYVNDDVLRRIFSKLGFGEISDEDLKILVDTADVDGDGKISLNDFRSMLNHSIDMGVFESDRDLNTQ